MQIARFKITGQDVNGNDVIGLRTPYVCAKGLDIWVFTLVGHHCRGYVSVAQPPTPGNWIEHPNDPRLTVVEWFGLDRCPRQIIRDLINPTSGSIQSSLNTL